MPNSNHDSQQPVDDRDVDVLRRLVEGTVSSTGPQFMQSLVRNLAAAIDVHYAFVAEFADTNTKVRTLAYWDRDHIADNMEFDLAGTPCQDVVRGSLCHHPTGVQKKFPEDRDLIDLGIESYLGVPLKDHEGTTLGHLAVFDERPMETEPRRLYIFRLFAERAAAELLRLRMERALVASELRYRDLFDEAPIAYVHEDLESRFISANGAAMRILGITPDQVAGTVGMSFVPDTPEAQKRVKEAFASVGRGVNTGGIILELRRRDNGKPIWIQWWSRPDRDGTSTRTMFIDITDHVLMEQEKARLEEQNVYLREEIQASHNFEEIIGQSSAMNAVLESVRKVADTDASVLITGETGTGKELIARAIHSNSRRRHRPLIKVNCAALPAGLVESEFFGHEKGAFSGAIAKRLGRFELADGGTIFLDEVGEIPLEAQAKLLRVLQEREFERVGGSSSIKVDVRIIAATNRDLRTAVKDRTFREDLYYRLNVFPISLPPLRERSEDIPLLVHFLAGKFASKIGRRLETVARQTLDRLQSYPWPGNVRELENVIERAVILSQGTTLDVPAELLSLSESPSSSASELVDLETIERGHLLRVLQQTGWVIDGPRGAAKILDLHPNTLRSRLKKLGIQRPPHDMP